MASKPKGSAWRQRVDQILKDQGKSKKGSPKKEAKPEG